MSTNHVIDQARALMESRLEELRQLMFPLAKEVSEIEAALTALGGDVADVVVPVFSEPAPEPVTDTSNGSGQKGHTPETVMAAASTLGAFTVRELAEKMGISPATSQYWIKKMVEANRMRQISTRKIRGSDRPVFGTVTELEAVEPKPRTRTRKLTHKFSEEQFRDAVAELGNFTVTELTMRLGSTHPRVSSAIERWEQQGKIAATGNKRLSRGTSGNGGGRRAKEYAYVKPTEPGAAASLDQLLREAEAPGRTEPNDFGPSGRALRTGNKEVSELIGAAQGAGCAVTKNGDGHYRVTTPSGEHLTVAATPSDRRFRDNARAALRRAGVTV